METNELIDQAAAKLGSYRAVGKYLGVTESFISGVRKGRRPLPAFQVAKLAELLEMNPAQAFVEAHIKNAAGKAEAATLKRWFQKVAAFIGVAFVVGGASGLWSPISTTYASEKSPSSDRYRTKAFVFNASNFRRAARRKGRLRGWLRSQLIAVARAMGLHTLADAPAMQLS